MQKTKFTRVIDALSSIQKLLQDNKLYEQCEKDFGLIGDYVGDVASMVVDAEGKPPVQKSRHRKSKNEDVKNEN